MPRTLSRLHPIRFLLDTYLPKRYKNNTRNSCKTSYVRIWWLRFFVSFLLQKDSSDFACPPLLSSAILWRKFEWLIVWCGLKVLIPFQSELHWTVLWLLRKYDERHERLYFYEYHKLWQSPLNSYWSIDYYKREKGCRLIPFPCHIYLEFLLLLIEVEF